MRTVAIVGAGRMGGALALALSRAGYSIDKFVARAGSPDLPFANYFNEPPEVIDWKNLNRVDSDLIFIATQDFEIQNAAKGLKPYVDSGQIVFHTSGSLSSSVLGELKDGGAAVGSIHPLISVSDAVSGAEKFKDSYFCLEGDDTALAVARDVVRDLGGKAFSIDTKFKALYHAGAVMAAGHVVALISMSLEILQKCGVGGHEASQIIKPLIKSTFDNVFAVGPEQALTGPFARADAETFERHLQIFRGTVNENVLEAYLSLAERSLEIAAERQRQPERFENLREKVLIEKKRLGC